MVLATASALALVALVETVQGVGNPAATRLVSTGPAGGNGAFTAQFWGASADGSRVFFVTAEKLVSADTDTKSDVYERSAGETTLVSTGPAGGNGAFHADIRGASVDGSQVFFQTAEQLIRADTDSQTDVYKRSGGITSLVSIGGDLIPGSLVPARGNGPFWSEFEGASADGSRVFISTREQLTTGDGDGDPDVYERWDGWTKLVSTGPASTSAATNANFRGSSADGTRVFFTTDERLVSADSDSTQDVYERSGGATTLVSTGPTGGNGTSAASFWDASTDGTRVFFMTTERLVSADTDSQIDVYKRSGGSTTLVSIGNLAPGSAVPAGGNGASDADFWGALTDGARVYFKTRERLASADRDASPDVYERSGRTTTLVSTGPAGGNGAFDVFFGPGSASTEGSRLFFGTAERLVSTDTDSQTDVYMRSGGATTLVSTGPAGGNGNSDADFLGTSADGSRVFFQTVEKLVTADQDTAKDIYMRSGATTRLVSTGPLAGGGAYNLSFNWAKTDGTRVFFTTTERLVSTDTDSSFDVYQRETGS